MVSSTPRPLFTFEKDLVTILQEARRAPGPVWTAEKSRRTGIRSANRPARSSVAIPTELPNFYYSNDKLLHVSATQGSHYQAVMFQKLRSRPQDLTFRPIATDKQLFLLLLSLKYTARLLLPCTAETCSSLWLL